MTLSASGLLVTCEHGGNRVPTTWKRLFQSAGAKAALRSHRGYDPGALQAAQEFARRMACPIIISRVTRLLVDLNRSLDNPQLFSEYSRSLEPADRHQVLSLHYHPYRIAVRQAVARMIDEYGSATHLSMHTFTPVIRKQWRPIDVGLLFDPSRKNESCCCIGWKVEFDRIVGDKRLVFNQPYLGIDDGLTTWLRGEFEDATYAGIEIEINHRFFKRTPTTHTRIVQALADALLAARKP